MWPLSFFSNHGQEKTIQPHKEGRGVGKLTVGLGVPCRSRPARWNISTRYITRLEGKRRKGANRWNQNGKKGVTDG